MMEPKIKQDISIGANTRAVRKKKGLRQTVPANLALIKGVSLTREALVTIERGTQHVQAFRLRAIKSALETAYAELLDSPGLKV